MTNNLFAVRHSVRAHTACRLPKWRDSTALAHNDSLSTLFLTDFLPYAHATEVCSTRETPRPTGLPQGVFSRFFVTHCL